MKSRPKDMIIDTAITVVCAGILIFCIAYLVTVEPEGSNLLLNIAAILAGSTAAVGVEAGCWAVISYFTEE